MTTESFITRTWRPFLGYSTGFVIIWVYCILPVLKIASSPIPSEVWLLLGSVLGTASYFRGRKQLNQGDSNVTDKV